MSSKNQTFNFMRKLIHFIAISLLMISLNNLQAQKTNPKPFILSTGSYMFTTWDTNASTGTYPANMILQWMDTNKIAPFYGDTGNTNYQASYNLTSGPRFNGLGNKGLAVITTHSSQSGFNEFTGCILLALNSTGRKNLQVSWKSQTITANTRIMNLRLQFRLDSTKLYTDVPGPVQFVSNATLTNDSLILGPVTLPATCDDQPYVELRWIYYESDGVSLSSSGKRGQIRFSDLIVSSIDSTVGITELSNNSGMNFTFTSGYGQLTINTTYNGNVIVNMYNLLGKLTYSNQTGFDQHTLHIYNLTKGIYLVSLFDKRTDLTTVKKVVVF